MAGGGHGGPAVQPCLFLLFPEGSRPSAGEVRGALARSGTGQVSHDPALSEAIVTASDWLEVVVDGLTFDLLGLAPGRSLQARAPRHYFGLAARDLAVSEGIGLAPGPHLAGAANAMPVVRTMLRLACTFTRQWEHALGALWLPADSVMQRDLFVSATEAWLAGGAFPALGLTGVSERPDGRLASDGLAFFTGQELVLDVALSADRVAATRLLVRLIDRLIGNPPLLGEIPVRLEDGRELRLVPTGAGIEVALG